MGAFFLYRDGANLDLGEVEVLFNRKGFSEPSVFQLGHWSLWLYKKQLLSHNNFFIDKDGLAVFVCGTVIYKGLGYAYTMQQILKDFRNKCLDLEELLGNFCILLWDGRNINVITDHLNVQHVFFNEERTCLSSSFLAVLVASKNTLKLNKIAFAEKLFTGYIVSPETIANGIYKLNEQLKSDGRWDAQLRFVTRTNRSFFAFHNRGIMDSIENQIETIKTYFKRVDILHCEFGGELGISGGYDARLILAASKYLSKPLVLHTHYTMGVHEKEKKIAEELSRISNCKLTFHPTRKMETLSDQELERTLVDNVLFFDGRCADGFGAFSETYTFDYRKAIIGDRRLSFNGIGGEIYRNHHFLPRKRTSFSEWAQINLFWPNSKRLIQHFLDFEDLKEHILSKMEKILDFSLRDGMDLFKSQAYYGLLRMPECRGTVNNAYNQVSFLLTPFVEYPLVIEALRAVPYLGTDGQYEAKLIQKLWPEIADVPSTHGFPFSKIPILYLMKCKVQSLTPYSIRYEYQRWRLENFSKSKEYLVFWQFWSKSRLMRRIKDVLTNIAPGLDVEKLTLHYAQRRVTIFVGFFLQMFSSKINCS